MGVLNLHGKFSSEEEKKQLVLRCENDFEKRLDEVASRISEISENNRIFTLSGPTCSGKTTTAKKIVETLSRGKRRVKVISLDDFFLGRKVPHADAVKYNLNVDYDSTASMDMEYLTMCLHAICRNNACCIPQYDFDAGARTGYEYFSPAEYDFVLIEGIQAVYPEISGILRPYGYCSIYISVENSVNIDGEVFSVSDIRFLRRLVRDCKYRASSLEFTFYYWSSVRNNEKASIIPYENSQDIKIDSTLLYEIPMIKTFAEEIFNTAKEGDRYYFASELYKKKLSHIDSISADYLPENSMYHEFLG